jgi:Rieske 2Fe-2S family protein
VRIGATGVLLTRDDGGSMHAFANICRHRGHELLACGASTVRGVVQCPYHAWSYELDGRCVLAPHFGDVPNFDREIMGLLPVAHAEWGGWVFVNVDGRAGPFAERLGALRDVVAPWGASGSCPAATHHYELQANWKIAIENYHECYHCPLIHPELCRVSPERLGDNIDDLPGPWVGGDMDLAERAETMSLDGRSGGRVLPGSTSAGAGRSSTSPVPEPAAQPAPGLRDDPPDRAAHADHSAVECQWLFPPEAARAARLRPSLRGRLLGPDQPAGLGRGRVGAAGMASSAVRAGPLQHGGGRGLPLRHDGRRRVPRALVRPRDGLAVLLSDPTTRPSTERYRGRQRAPSPSR